MIVFIFINSVILFILMQILGVPLSNLAVIDFKYDTFTFSKDKSTSGMNIIYNMLLANIYMLFIYELVEGECKIFCVNRKKEVPSVEQSYHNTFTEKRTSI